jgi:hypothetical protein
VVDYATSTQKQCTYAVAKLVDFMPRKRHSLETLLTKVVSLIESDNDRDIRQVVSALVLEGPLMVEITAADLSVLPIDAFLTPRAEALQFLRTIVRLNNVSRAQMGTHKHFNFTAEARGDVVMCSLAGELSDVTKLQLVVLLRMLGLPKVRRCQRAGCLKIFVKRYRREYCSRQCQNRVFMAEKRRSNRERANQLKKMASARRGHTDGRTQTAREDLVASVLPQRQTARGKQRERQEGRRTRSASRA